MKRIYYCSLFLIFACAGNSDSDTLSIPKRFSARAGDAKVFLSWGADADVDVSSYEIVYGRYFDNLNLRKKDILGRTTSSITITSLTNDIEYFFKLRSLGRVGLKSNFTPIISAIPKAKAISVTDEINIVTWNIENFYNPNRAPLNDEQQYVRVKNIINTFSFDIIGMQEISSKSKFDILDDELNLYSGVLSRSSYQSDPQNIAVLFNNIRFTKLSTKRLTNISDNSGRPPLEVKFRKNDSQFEFYIIVIHAKANNQLRSYNRRKNFSRSLFSYLHYSRKTDYVVLLGDFNDKMIGSITNGKVSPYKNFVDSDEFTTITSRFNEGNQNEYSMPGFSNTIDHIVLSDEFTLSFFKNQNINILEEELRVIYSDYERTISDHFPVKITLKF